MGKFEQIKNMWKIGPYTVPASSSAEALQIKNALVKTGKLEKKIQGEVLQDLGPVDTYKPPTSKQKPLEAKLDVPEEELPKSSVVDKALDYASRPQKSLLNAVSALQQGQSGGELIDAAKSGLTLPSDQSKSGYDIVSKLSDDTGITDPLLLTGLATGLDVFADPSMALGKIGKVGKGIKSLDKFDKIRKLFK